MSRKISLAEQAALTAARLVFPDTERSERGDELLLEWEKEAQDNELAWPQMWLEDWRALQGAFLRTEGALKNLRLYREVEELEPVVEEGALEKWFASGEDWTLTHSGEVQGCTVRVWMFEPWEGHLAYSIAHDDETEEVRTHPTSLAT